MTRPTTDNPDDPYPYGYGAASKRGDVMDAGLHSEGHGTVWLLGHDLTYTVRCATGDNGPYVTELSISSDDNRPLTSEDLRSIPLRRLAVTIMTMDRAWKAHTAGEPEPVLDNGVTHRKRHLDDALLREVAEQARMVFRRGARVRDLLAEQYHVSPYTIDKWLAKAREAGHLQSGELSRKRK